MCDMSSTSSSVKARGNALMKEGKYVDAIVLYSEGIAMEPANPVLYSNRSLAFLKLSQYFFAMKDAENTIRLIPDWAKGYYRKGQAELGAEMYPLAIATFEEGLKACPTDAILKKALDDTKRREKNYIAWKQSTVRRYTIIAGLIGVLLIIGDVVLKPRFSYLRHPWIRGMLVTCSAFLGYIVASIVIATRHSSKAALLHPPTELMCGTNLDYSPIHCSKFGNTISGDSLMHKSKFH